MVSIWQIKEARAERKKVEKEIHALIPENGILRAEDHEKFDQLEARCKELDGSIERMERTLERMQERQDEEDEERQVYPQLDGEGGDAEEARARETRVQQALFAVELNGEHAISPDLREVLVSSSEEEVRVSRRRLEDRAMGLARSYILGQEPTSEEREILVQAPRDALRRASETASQRSGQSYHFESLGGIMIPRGVIGGFLRAKKRYGSLREPDDSNVFTTDTGIDYEYPIENDVNKFGTLVGTKPKSVPPETIDYENATSKTSEFSSLPIRIPWKLIRDGNWNQDPAEYVFGIAGRRIEREFMRRCVVSSKGGDGPKGLIHSVAKGHTAAAPDTLSWKDLVKLLGSIDPDHQVGDAFRFSFNQTSLTELMLQTDLQNRPVWQASAAVGEPNTVIGRPYRLNQYQPSPKAGAQGSVLCGDFMACQIRDVRYVMLVRLVEKFAENSQTGYLVLSSHGFLYLNAGDDPIKRLDHPS